MTTTKLAEEVIELIADINQVLGALGAGTMEYAGFDVEEQEDGTWQATLSLRPTVPQSIAYIPVNLVVRP